MTSHRNANTFFNHSISLWKEVPYPTWILLRGLVSIAHRPRKIPLKTNRLVSLLIRTRHCPLGTPSLNSSSEAIIDTYSLIYARAMDKTQSTMTDSARIHAQAFRQVSMIAFSSTRDSHSSYSNSLRMSFNYWFPSYSVDHERVERIQTLFLLLLL